MSGTPPSSTSSAIEHRAYRQGSGSNGLWVPGTSLRRWFYLMLLVSSSALGAWMMLEILLPKGLTVLEALLLLLFITTFTWVVSAFWSATIGFVLQLFRLDPYSLRRIPRAIATAPVLRSRTAVVMPVYNENTARIIAGLECNIRSLAQTGQADAFDFFLLSDTQDRELAIAELNAWQGLQQRLGPLAERVYYRRRRVNRQRKVGNLADFCQRWGANYDFMIVLDADSLMRGECMVELATRMEANDNAGLIQTVPLPVRQTTLFGRFLQFAANLYSPLLASGFAFWHGDNANYWGHNAIIRVRAFMECCGLPTLDGRAPFGGEILSHDFVEAALLYRGGWGVYLATDLDGSFEEVPANILDYVKRDRRWVQGNLQHLALLGSRGLSTLSRIHFLFGALAYISSLLWLCMLLFSSVDAIFRATSADVFFSQAYQLFPSWPTAKADLILMLLYLTVFILFAPKVMGCINALVHRRREFGGSAALLAGTVIELFSAVIVAPLMMCFHSFFVVSVLLGFDVKWSAQQREGRIVSWLEAWYRSFPIFALAVIWSAIMAYLSPLFLYWMSPVLTGMLLAPLLIRYGSSNFLGGLTRRMGLFKVPAEQCREPLLLNMDSLMGRLSEYNGGSAPEPALPKVRWRSMPVQSL